MAQRPSRQRVYDHRLRKLVWETGNPDLFPDLAIPRSTLAGWLREPPPEVVTVDWLVHSEVSLLLTLHKTEKRNAILLALLRLLLTLVRVRGCHLDGQRLPDGGAKAKVLAAIESARKALPIAAILAVLHLSAARYHAWRRAEVRCGLTDRASCPRTSPTQLTAKEIGTIHEMVTSSDYRHMSLSCLAVFAQREGRVFAAPSTWTKLTRERQWLRPRQRVYPAKPKIGIRASGPNEVWHVDTTIIRLLDGTRLYLHGIIDNYSRRILSWRLKERFEPKVTTCELLREAARELPPDTSAPTLMVLPVTEPAQAK
jgi:putative transposase